MVWFQNLRYLTGNYISVCKEIEKLVTNLKHIVIYKEYGLYPQSQKYLFLSLLFFRLQVSFLKEFLRMKLFLII